MADVRINTNMAVVYFRQAMTFFLIGYHGNLVDSQDIKMDNSNRNDMYKVINLPKGNLTCHHCYVSTHGVSCLDGNEDKMELQECNIKQHFCQVEKYLRDGELVTFTRGCSEKCQPGCVTVGSSLGFPHQYCYSCCNHDYCNTMSTASSKNTAHPVLAVLAFLVYWLVGG